MNCGQYTSNIEIEKGIKVYRELQFRECPVCGCTDLEMVWVTDGLDDWRTDKEVTEELMDFIDTEISKAREEGFKEGERSRYYEISGYFSQTEGEHILERGKEYVIISREEYDKLSKLKDNK
jgi:hypothetical protein